MQLEKEQKSNSLQAYLKRRSTAELETALTYFVQEQHRQNYEYTIREILLVLEERYSTTAFPPHLAEAREKFWQDRFIT